MAETWTYIICASFTILFLLSKLLLSKNTRNTNRPPGPPKLPVLGHLHLIKEPVHRCLQHLSNKYGPIIYLSFGSRPVVVISSPALVEECFTKNDIVLADRPRLLVGKYLHYNNTTIGAADYGDHWRNQRRLATLEIFSANRLNMFSGIRKEEVRMLVKNLFQSSGNQSFVKVEMRTRLSELSFNIIMRMVAGKRYFGIDVDNLEDAESFRDIIRESFEVSGTSNPRDFLPVLRWIDYQSFEKRLKRVQVKMDAFFQSLIDEHRSKRGTFRGEDKRNRTMIDVVLSLQESEPEHYTDETIKALIMALLTAGTDTSTVTIEWAMSLLLNHPSVLKKARAELDEQIGQDRLAEDPDLSKLHYIQCIIKETLRLFPAAPLLVPHKSSDDCIIGGYNVPRGTTLFVNAWGLHRDPKVWEDPNSFKPERFEDLETEAYRLVPFGLGRRSCPGAGLANRVVGLGLATMIQCFEWQRVSEEKINMSEGTGLTMPKLVPLEAMCKARKCMTNVLSEL